MPGNYHKLWIQGSLNQVAITRALEQIQQLGRALPCRVKSVLGSIVQVEFGPLVTSPQTLPPVWMPVGAPQWLRYPLQEGDLGVTMPADTFLGGVSGLGDGLADTTVNYGNLTTLVFVPVGNTGFTAAPDANRIWLNGPNGFDITDAVQTGGCRYDKETQTLTLFAGENTIVLTADPSVITTITGQYGSMQTIVDAASNAISFVPVGAGAGIPDPVVALGALASGLDATRAAAAHADLDTLINDASNGVIAKTLQTLATAIGAASVTAAMPGAMAFSAILSAAGWVKGLSGIQPTIPGCSSIVRLAE